MASGPSFALHRYSLGVILRAAVLLALFLALATTSGCRRSSGEQLKSVRIGYFASLAHAQAIEGVASGEFAAAVAPVALDTEIFNAGPSLIEALFAGEIDIAYVGPGPIISACAHSGGRGLRVISGATANGVVIVARSSSGIRQMEDLRDRQIATPELGNTQDLSARHFVLDVLKQPNANNVTPIANPEQAGMLLRGKIDAAWVPEPWGEFLVQEAGATLVGEEKDLWPNKTFGLAYVVTSPTFLARHPDVVEKILRVHHRWTHRLAAEPDTYAQSLGDAIQTLTGKRMPTGILTRSLHHIDFVDDVNDDTLRQFADWSRDIGLGVRPGGRLATPDFQTLVDTTMIRQISR